MGCGGSQPDIAFRFYPNEQRVGQTARTAQMFESLQRAPPPPPQRAYVYACVCGGGCAQAARRCVSRRAAGVRTHVRDCGRAAARCGAVSREDINRFYTLFMRMDMDSSDSVDRVEFFRRFGIEKTAFADAVFAAMGAALRRAAVARWRDEQRAGRRL